MKMLTTLVVVALSLSPLAVAGCVGTDQQPDVSVGEALEAQPALLVGRYRFVYTDERRAAVEGALKTEAKSPEAFAEAAREAEKEAAASEIEFAKDGTFHSRVYDKEILSAPYVAKGATTSTLVLVMTKPGGEEARTTVRFQDADTIIIQDPKKGELTFRRVNSRG